MPIVCWKKHSPPQGTIWSQGSWVVTSGGFAAGRKEASSSVWGRVIVSLQPDHTNHTCDHRHTPSKPPLSIPGPLPRSTFFQNK